jgi:hypothetical protein
MSTIASRSTPELVCESSGGGVLRDADEETIIGEAVDDVDVDVDDDDVDDVVNIPVGPPIAAGGGEGELRTARTVAN